MRKLLLLLALMGAVSCMTEPAEETTLVDVASAKIIGAKSTPVAGMLLVRIAKGETLPSFDIVDVEIASKPLFVSSTRSRESKLDRWYLLTFDAHVNVEEVAKGVAKYRSIEVVEYETRFKPTKCMSAPLALETNDTRASQTEMNDPMLSYQWHYNNDGTTSPYSKEGADINLFNAWRYCLGDNRVIVAVIDGGIMTDHPDLKDNLWVNEGELHGLTGVDDDGNGYVDDVHGYNFVWDKGEITPDLHGTHVAGTIAAVNNNGIGLCGIAGGSGKGDGVRLMSMQIFDGDEGCYTHQIAQAFEYAADMGAVIANNSWGYDPYTYYSDKEYEQYDGLIKNAIDYFESNARLEGVMEGGIAIFAAGNETANVSDYPAAYHRYISVTAMAPNYKATYYTNYGPGCNVCAPGGDLYYGDEAGVASTAYNTDATYMYLQGTSMATPHVSGCAALAVSYAAQRGYSITAEELRKLILTSVQDVNPYQAGKRPMYNDQWERWENMSIAHYAGELGSGYIDAHLLLMQLDGTPCLYFRCNEESRLSLDAHFGYGSQDLSYTSVEVSDEVCNTLGITTMPTIENGLLKVQCSKPGVGRIKVAAIIGGDNLGGNDMIGGMLIEREFEIVVRGAVAKNGGWL